MRRHMIVMHSYSHEWWSCRSYLQIYIYVYTFMCFCIHLIWVALHLFRAALCHVFCVIWNRVLIRQNLQDINNAYITPGISQVSVYTLNHFSLTMMNVGGTGCSRRDSVMIDMFAMQDRSPDNWQEFLKLSGWLDQNLEVGKVLVGPFYIESQLYDNM